MYEKNRVRSGWTKEVSKIVAPLYLDDIQKKHFLEPKSLLAQMEAIATAPPATGVSIITELLSQPRAPKYRYLVYYLLEYFRYDIEEDPTYKGSVEAQADVVFEEIHKFAATKNAERYNTSCWLKKLTDLVFDLAIENGFTYNKTRIHASLTDDGETWTRTTLCRDLFSENSSKLNRNSFFALALILSTDEQFIQQYLTRGQLPSSEKVLDLWNIEELLVYVFCKLTTTPSNIYESYRMLYKLYNSEECDADSSRYSRHSTYEIKDIADSITNSVNSLVNCDTETLRNNVLNYFRDHKWIIQEYKLDVQKYKKLPPSPHCRLMAEYLIEKYHDNPALEGITSDFLDTICTEVENYAGEYGEHAKWQTILTDCVFDTMSQEGFCAPDRATAKEIHHYVYSCLWNNSDVYQWSPKALCQTLFVANEMQISEFFTLAVALSMDIDFVRKYYFQVFSNVSKSNQQLCMDNDTAFWHGMFNATKVPELIAYLLCTGRATPANTTRYELFRLLQKKTAELSLTQAQKEQEKEKLKEAADIWERIDVESDINETNLDKHPSPVHLLSVVNTSLDIPGWKVGMFKRKTISPSRKKLNVHRHTAERNFLTYVKQIEGYLPEDRRGKSLNQYVRALSKELETAGISVNGKVLDMMANNFPSNSELSKIRDSTHCVTRKQFLTAAFLSQTAQYIRSFDSQSDVQEAIDALITDLNKELREAGFDEIYLLNQYDCFLICVSLLEDPFDFYLRMWARTL